MKSRKKPHGGFLIGLVVGLLIGLAAALGVALYVTKVPIPFIDKVPNRTADQDAAEAARNRNWDPNAALNGKSPSRPPATPAVPPPAPAVPPTLPPPPAIATAPGAASGRPVPATPPGGDAATKPARTAAGMSFYAQAGAFTRVDDAQAQRAKLALLGLDAQVSEREQAGRTVYRVRVGPFDARAQADAAIDKLQGAGVDATLVRVERQ
jgi:cell division protein FtsN